MEIKQFLNQLTLGLNQLEIKGQSNVALLAYLMNLVNEYSNNLLNKDQESQEGK